MQHQREKHFVHPPLLPLCMVALLLYQRIISQSMPSLLPGRGLETCSGPAPEKQDRHRQQGSACSLFKGGCYHASTARTHLPAEPVRGPPLPVPPCPSLSLPVPPGPPCPSRSFPVPPALPALSPRSPVERQRRPALTRGRRRLQDNGAGKRSWAHSPADNKLHCSAAARKGVGTGLPQALWV